MRGNEIRHQRHLSVSTLFDAAVGIVVDEFQVPFPRGLER